MIKVRLKLRKVVAIAICLAAFTANQALAQTYNHTDASGVSWTYSLMGSSDDEVNIVKVTNLPPTVTKWVIPDVIIHNGTQTRKVTFTGASIFQDLPLNTTLREIVFPKYLITLQIEGMEVGNASTKVSNLHKITLGEAFTGGGSYMFNGQPLDTIIFKGGVPIYLGSNSFSYCPAHTKIIVPCGTMEAFRNHFASDQQYRWQEERWGYPEGAVTWTTANFVEAECLNTLTVLSSDVSLGNAISTSGCGTLTTTTPDNTTATFSGTATLYALAKKDKVFTGWADGNVDNPRTVSVSSDTTFTANFATCTETGIRSAQAAAPLKVYPNPANSTLYVESENWINNGTLTLFDMSGKVVLSQAVNGNSAQINMSSLTAGNYILRLVENGTASAGVQVIKQ